MYQEYSHIQASELVTLGVQFKRQGHYSKAITLYEQALQVCPTYYEAYKALAKTLFLLKDKNNSIQCYLTYLHFQIAEQDYDLSKIQQPHYQEQLLCKHFLTLIHLGRAWIDLNEQETETLIQHIFSTHPLQYTREEIQGAIKLYQLMYQQSIKGNVSQLHDSELNEQLEALWRFNTYVNEDNLNDIYYAIGFDVAMRFVAWSDFK